jgi:hypothetical protein
VAESCSAFVVIEGDSEEDSEGQERGGTLTVFCTIKDREHVRKGRWHEATREQYGTVIRFQWLTAQERQDAGVPAGGVPAGG